MKFELDPESSEQSFWEFDQFEHDSSHPDGAFCVPVLHSEREWQVCLLLYFFYILLLSFVLMPGSKLPGMACCTKVSCIFSFDPTSMSVILWRSQHGCRTLRDASNWPILNTYSIAQKHSITQSHAFPWIHQVRRAIHLKFYRFSSGSCTNLSFLISYSTNQQINHTINQASNPANDSINQKTPPSISISLPTGFLSGRLSHAVYQTLLTSLRRPAAPGSAPDCVAQKRWESFPTHSNTTHHNKQCRTDVYIYI